MGSQLIGVSQDGARVDPPPPVDDVLPVGAIFISIDSTNPATSLGYGTWVAFGAGQVLVGLDSGQAGFDAPEETGGALTVAAAGSNSQPTFTGTPLGTHSHGVGTYLPSVHAGSAVADHASHTHTYTQVPNHVHGFTDLRGATTGGATTNRAVTEAADTSSTATGLLTGNPSGGVATGTTAGPSATLTHNVTQPNAHTMAGSSEAVGAGTPAGTVSTPSFTGSPTSVVQPYIVVYMFKRTA